MAKNPTLFNSTIFKALGAFTYAVCENSTYSSLEPGSRLEQNVAKACNLNGVLAIIEMGNGKRVIATPYRNSKGTTYSDYTEFLIVQTGVESFIVTRKVT